MGNTSRAAREMATVDALKMTVRPAVLTVCTTAGWGSRPLWISSR